MPFIKVTYSSPNNVSVQGADYFEVAAEDLSEDGSVPERVISEVWQEAVNEFMSDTYAEVIETEDER